MLHQDVACRDKTYQVVSVDEVRLDPNTDCVSFLVIVLHICFYHRYRNLTSKQSVLIRSLMQSILGRMVEVARMTGSKNATDLMSNHSLLIHDGLSYLTVNLALDNGNNDKSVESIAQTTLQDLQNLLSMNRSMTSCHCLSRSVCADENLV